MKVQLCIGVVLIGLMTAPAFGAGNMPAPELAIPPTLAPPKPAKLAVKLIGAGVQIYACVAKAAGQRNEWAEKGPEGQISDFGANFAGNLRPGPTWEAKDGSKLTGKMLIQIPAMRTNALPWVLYGTHSSGRGVFAGVRFVQRLDTVQGLAPAGACDHPGEEYRSQFAAIYYFYK